MEPVTTTPSACPASANPIACAKASPAPATWIAPNSAPARAHSAAPPPGSNPVSPAVADAVRMIRALIVASSAS
jgi:hypothetical protein